MMTYILNSLTVVIADTDCNINVLYINEHLSIKKSHTRIK